MNSKETIPPDHPRITLHESSGIKYIYIDYQGLSTEEMVDLLEYVINYSVENRLPFIANFKKAPVKTAYLKKSNEWIAKTKNLIPFGAFIGLDFTNSLLLDTYLSLNGMKHRHFNSRKEAEDAIVLYYKTLK
jgi:hypothetical protein